MDNLLKFAFALGAFLCLLCGFVAGVVLTSEDAESLEKERDFYKNQCETLRTINHALIIEDSKVSDTICHY